MDLNDINFLNEIQFDFNALVQECHQNAVKHGFWEEGKPGYETAALIHSEWSEVLEEARAGRGLVWYNEERDHKPEGIAVEIIDGIIRIFDWLGHEKVQLSDGYSHIRILDIVANDSVELSDEHEHDFVSYYCLPGIKDMDVAELVCTMHYVTTAAYIEYTGGTTSEERLHWIILLLHMIASGFAWIAWHGEDPIKLLKEKQEYNRKRPYKHGKKF